MKRSIGKETRPGSKQVWRLVESGAAIEDVIVREGRDPGEPAMRPLLKRVMSDGRRVLAPAPLTAIRAHSQAALAALPESVRRIHSPETYKVRIDL
jgi:hypothetical protein